MARVDTPHWKFRLDPSLRLEAMQVAQEQHEPLSAVIVRALRAYVADPQAFNAAVATIRGGQR